MTKKINQLPIRPIRNRETANAFLFGLIFNQNQKAERSWEAPHVLKKRIGSLNPKLILETKDIALVTIIREKPALHPFAQSMANYLHKASALLIKQYKGDARNIWSPLQTTSELLRRFNEFPGVGNHKASVGVFLLRHELGVSVLEDGTFINIRKTCPSLCRLYGENN